MTAAPTGQQPLGDLADRVSDLVAVVDGRGSLLYLNPAGRALLGVPPDAPAGDLTVEGCVAPADVTRLADEIGPALRRAGSWTGPVQLLDRAGTPVPVRLQLCAHRDPARRIAHVSAIAHDLRDRRSGDPALQEERERYRLLVAQAPVGIWVSDLDGTPTFVNEHVARLTGRAAEELVGPGWARYVHPDDRAEVAASWAAAVREGAEWEHEHRIVDAAGVPRVVTSTARPLHEGGGAVSGFLGTTVDVTEQRAAERARRDGVAASAAQRVSDAAAARLRTLVDGLAAIVWEAEWDPVAQRLRFTFVSDRAEELLGHPARRWTDEPEFWPALLHGDDRAAALAHVAERTAAGLDHDLTYRACTADGRAVWLHQIGHVTGSVPGPARVQGLSIDVTDQQRAERSGRVLAETGRLLSDPGTVEEKLTALTQLVVHDFGDAAVVSLLGPDGLARRLAVAHDEPDVERAFHRLAPTRIPPELHAALGPGRPVVVPVTDRLSRATAGDEPDAERRLELGATSVLVVPLVTEGSLAGMLGFPVLGGERRYDDADLELASELGRRASLMLETDRRRERERHIRQVTADLAVAGTLTEAARLLVHRLRDVLGAGAMTVYLVDPDREVLQLVGGVGHSDAWRARYTTVRADAQVPVAQAVRSGTGVWIRDREQWDRDWPHLLRHALATDRHAFGALPLTSGGAVVGAIGMSFPTPRTFPPDEQAFVAALVAQAAPALERAAAADRRRQIAETLQRSLLPPAVPGVARLALAARYLPGAPGTQAGGDWYDVLPLDGDRVAIAVGDVVGQGSRAAAVMGQLRSVLSGYLLEGHPPVRAVEHLDAFARRIPGATGSTVTCLVLDTGSGELEWARAGHPPPLVVGPGGARFLDDATGTVLGVRGRPPYRAGAARLEAGDSAVLYTDGLVERRGEDVDVGLERIAAAGSRGHALDPAGLAAALLSVVLADDAAPDDIALLVARLVPAPLEVELTADHHHLRVLRHRVAAWAGAAGVDPDEAYDLQLAVGEAAANVVEHAYLGRPRPGPVRVRLARRADGGVNVRVSDEGRWRPTPADPGYRGRGLTLIEQLGDELRVLRGTGGTTVRVVLPAGRAATGEPPPPQGATQLSSTRTADGMCVQVLGDLDPAGAAAVRPALLAACGAGTAERGSAMDVDLRTTTHLASAGLALLVEAAEVARAADRRFRVLAAPAGGVRRVLALSGIEREVPVTDS